MHTTRRDLLLAATTLPLIGTAAADTDDALDSTGFERLLDQLAEGWKSGDAKAAAACCTADAIDLEPPRTQLYRSRAELFAFFGGDSGRPGAMHMQWHRRKFDTARQQGMGEFSFRYGSQVHGVAVIDIVEGLIAQWREYWYRSELPFDEFVAPGRV
jgi:hypothetical protein